MFTRCSARLALPAALAALVLGAAPALTIAPVHAAPAPAKPWVSVSGPAAFSPNGDGRKDTAKFTVKVKKRAAVTVRVLRDGKVLRGPVKLGTRKAGAKFTWTWNGKDSKGRRVPDGFDFSGDRVDVEGYVVTVVARPITKGKAKPGKKVAARANVVVDTDAGLRPGAYLVTDTDVIQPGTEGAAQHVRFQVDGAADWINWGSYYPWQGTGTLVIRNARGQEVHRVTTDAWGRPAFSIVWNGQPAWGNTVQPGDYTAVLRVQDEVGNVDETEPITVRVS